LIAIFSIRKWRQRSAAKRAALAAGELGISQCVNAGIIESSDNVPTEEPLPIEI